jgi:hypothetical protein
LAAGIGQDGSGVCFRFLPQLFGLLLGSAHEGVGCSLGVDQRVTQRLVEVRQLIGLALRCSGALSLDQTRLSRDGPGLGFSQPALELLDLFGQGSEAGQHPIHLVSAVTPGFLLKSDVRNPPEQT